MFVSFDEPAKCALVHSTQDKRSTKSSSWLVKNAQATFGQDPLTSQVTGWFRLVAVLLVLLVALCRAGEKS